MTHNERCNHASSGTATCLVVVPLVGAALSLALMLPVGAVSGTDPVEHLVAQVATAPAPDDGRIDIYVERWTSDTDVDAIRPPFLQGDYAKVLALLREQRRAGVVVLPSVRYGTHKAARGLRKLLFARETAGGAGRQVIVMSDERFELGESRAAAFNAIDIRFGADGTGVGKVAAAANVAFSTAAKTVEVTDFSSRPPRLVNVRSAKP